MNMHSFILYFYFLNTIFQFKAMKLLIYNLLSYMCPFYWWLFSIFSDSWLRWYITFLQPVKIVDPHLVSSFFDNYKRVYLHTTVKLVNKSNLVAECSLNIQVGTELEGNLCSVDHLQTQHVSVPAGTHIQYTMPQVSSFPLMKLTMFYDCTFFPILLVHRKFYVTLKM